MSKMADIGHPNFDSRSIGLCIGTIFLKYMAEINTSDIANIFAAIAAITTIAYNGLSFYKKFIKKRII